MKSVSKFWPAAGLVLALASAGPVAAQQPAAAPAKPAAPATPACLTAARDYLSVKGAGQLYAAAVPRTVEQAARNLLQANLNYQKDLNEVAVIVAKNLAGREKEIGEAMAQAYCMEYSEQELKDLAAFYRTPLGAKTLTADPKAFQASMGFMQNWAQGFMDIATDEMRAEMKKRGKPI